MYRWYRSVNQRGTCNRCLSIPLAAKESTVAAGSGGGAAAANADADLGVGQAHPWLIRSNSATLVNFTRGLPRLTPAVRSWSSISFQWSSVTSFG